MTEGEVVLADEAATLRWAADLAAGIEAGTVIFLRGDLGMGKTTICRGVLRGLGHAGVVKSPTYTLVEPYELSCGLVCHFDLYRLADPEELEMIGLRDYLQSAALCLFEWPERGAGHLPRPDLELDLGPGPDDRGRQLRWRTHSALGRRILE